MRLSSLASARPAYYDRNAVSVFQAYLAQTAPHATTTRYTYTVAAGKKLLVEHVGSRLLRTSAAAPVGQFGIEQQVTNGTNQILLSERYSLDNTVNAVTDDIRGLACTIYAGETITGITLDSSTGGLVQYWVSSKGTLYDA